MTNEWNSLFISNRKKDKFVIFIFVKLQTYSFLKHRNSSPFIVLKHNNRKVHENNLQSISRLAKRKHQKVYYITFNETVLVISINF